MTTPEDLAKARDIYDSFNNKCNSCHFGGEVNDRTDFVNAIAQALAEARTAPKPAAEVVEALEELLSECESSYNKDSECVTDDHETLFGKVTMGSIHKARAALAAQSAKEKP